MRYEEIGGPLDGWTYDERGTIYTASGYKCSARTLECALWLFQCYSGEARKYLIHSDERPGALRPLYETSDAKQSAGNDHRLIDEATGSSPEAPRARPATKVAR